MHLEVDSLGDLILVTPHLDPSRWDAEDLRPLLEGKGHPLPKMGANVPLQDAKAAKDTELFCDCGRCGAESALRVSIAERSVMLRTL